MALTLPIDSRAERYSVAIPLDGDTYRFDVTWNVRESTWYVDLSDSDGNPLANGLRVTVGWDLLNSVTGENRPPESIIVLDLENTGTDPGRNDLGSRVILVYV